MAQLMRYFCCFLAHILVDLLFANAYEKLDVIVKCRFIFHLMFIFEYNRQRETQLHIGMSSISGDEGPRFKLYEYEPILYSSLIPIYYIVALRGDPSPSHCQSIINCLYLSYSQELCLYFKPYQLSGAAGTRKLDKILFFDEKSLKKG